MTRPSTLVVVHTCGAKGLSSEVLQRQAHLPYALVLPSPEQAAYPHGSHTEAYIYRLSRPDDALRPLTHIDGSHMRTLRDCVHKARTQGGRVHVVGAVDLDSPVGSRRALESLLRHTQGLGVSFVVHPAVWHATPSEVRYGLRELQTLLTPGETEFGAVFDLHSHSGAPLKARFAQALPQHVVLSPADVVLIANHDMHGLHPFAEGLMDHYGVTVLSLPFEVPASPPVMDSLSRKQHVVSAVSRPSYERAYAGSVSHPYYESFYHPKATELLGMLVSPHFDTRPDHLFVGIDAEAHPDFKSLLRSLLQQQSNRNLVCCFVDPHGIDRSLVLSNMPIQSDGSVYHHVHRSLR